MLPNVYYHMFKYAKKYIEENSKYSPEVLRNTPPEKKFPLIIIKQIDDYLYDENLDKTDQRFEIAYDIDIYTMNSKTIAKETIARELIKLVNDVFDEHFGMLRADSSEAPNIDTDVYRWNMKYEGKLDENNIIYRR